MLTLQDARLLLIEAYSNTPYFAAYLQFAAIMLVWIGMRLLFRLRYKRHVPARLASYADMLGLGPVEQEPKGVPLSSGQHKVLLGILKKVEAKNSTLARIWTFVGAACATVFSNPKTFDWARELAHRGLLYAIAGLIISISGMWQVDQFSSSARTKDKMQNALINDMLAKEASFRLSIHLAYFALVYFVIRSLIVILQTFSD